MLPLRCLPIGASSQADKVLPSIRFIVRWRSKDKVLPAIRVFHDTKLTQRAGRPSVSRIGVKQKNYRIERWINPQLQRQLTASLKTPAKKSFSHKKKPPCDTEAFLIEELEIPVYARR